MANGTDFDGSNAKYTPPEGVSEDQCKTLHVFKNGACIVSCWELDDAELAEVIRTRRVFSSIWSGQKLYPQFIGSESTVHALVADTGKVWRLSDNNVRKFVFQPTDNAEDDAIFAERINQASASQNPMRFPKIDGLWRITKVDVIENDLIVWVTSV